MILSIVSSDRLKNLSGYGIVFFVLCLRTWDRIVHPVLWAEDGAIFLNKAYQIGAQSLFEFYGGWLHLLPRLIGLFFSGFPPHLFPFHWMVNLITLVSILIASLCFSYFLSEDFRLILPNRSLRLLAAIAFCFSPGLFELLGNLANLHWFCSFFLFLVSLRSESAKLSYSQVIFSLLCVWSSGETIILFPIFLIRIFLQQKQWIRNSAKSLLFFNPDLVISSSIVLSSVLNVINGCSDKTLHSVPNLYELLTTWIFGIGNWIFLFPLFGFRLTHNIGRFAPAVFFLIFGTLLLVTAVKVINSKENRRNWLFFLIYIFLIIPLMFLARGHSIIDVFGRQPIYQWADIGRYAFVLGPYGVFFWILLLTGRKKTKKNTAILACFLCLYCLNGALSGFWIRRHDGAGVAWEQLDSDISRVSRTQTSEKVYIPCAPKGWGFWFSAKTR